MKSSSSTTERTWSYGRLILGALAIAAVGRFADHPLPTFAALGVVSLLIYSTCCAVDGVVLNRGTDEERTESRVGGLLSLMTALALGGWLWLFCATGGASPVDLIRL